MDSSQYGTSGGIELTNEVIEDAANEAEAGYDLERLRPRSRRGRPRMGSEAASPFQVRLDPELRADLMQAAEYQQASPSEVARNALREHLSKGAPLTGQNEWRALSPEVLTRIRSELGTSGDKVVNGLRTAAFLIAQARLDQTHLRLAESAAYNLREALDAVVQGQPPLAGGIASVLEAWKRYQITTTQPAADEKDGRAAFERVMRQLEKNEERQEFKTRKLLSYILDQTGIEPLAGESDPSIQYAKLRKRANGTLHQDGNVAEVTVLYEDAITWFARFFTPPDTRVKALAALAEKPFNDQLIPQLRALILNAHDLGLFLSRLQDANWLMPLYAAKLIQLPRSGEPWPLASLASEASRIDSTRIADVLDLLLTDVNSRDKNDRLGYTREILQTASRLGPTGYRVAEKAIRKYPNDQWVRMVAASLAQEADPTDPIQLTLGQALIGNTTSRDRDHYSRLVLKKLIDGLTASNAVDRIKLTAGKLRTLAAEPRMKYIALDIAALTTSDGDLRDPVLILSQHLIAMVRASRRFSMSTADLLQLIGTIDGQLGERITCQIITNADDVSREAKVAHISKRLASSIATGDDRDLIVDILKSPLRPAEVSLWSSALGQPSQISIDSDSGSNQIPDDWARAWRWSIILPSQVLEGWEIAIATVTGRHGTPSSDSLDTRRPSLIFSASQSAYTAEELDALSALEAAAMVSSWRPGTYSDWPNETARQLARTLEAAVKRQPRQWTNDPSAVVTALREPIYVSHYFQAITEVASDVADRCHALLEAASLVRSERWEPAVIGRDDFEYDPDWSSLDCTIVQTIAALAHSDGDLEADLNLCWTLATSLIPNPSDGSIEVIENDSGSEFYDPLDRAINQHYGKAMQTVIAIAGWEHRRYGAPRQLFFNILADVLIIPGDAGLELRSLVAAHRLFFETVAAEWLDTHADTLFETTLFGTKVFDQTLKWSRPSRWFLSRYQAELLTAARRGTKNAISWLLIGYLWSEPGYTFDKIVHPLSGDAAALRATGEEIAALMQGLSTGDSMVQRGVQFWENLIDTDRSLVPAEALYGLGRWTFVDAINDAQWIRLMDRTLQISGGTIDLTSEIADRCKAIEPSEESLRILRLMIGRGETWERHHVETAALEALRQLPKGSTIHEASLLRIRLIERGRHEAVAIAVD